MTKSEIAITCAEALKELLLYFYPADSRYVKAIEKVLSARHLSEEDIAYEISQIGWSGSGSFVDSVLCDLINSPSLSMDSLARADYRQQELMRTLAHFAISVDANIVNNQAMKEYADLK